jgi:hypothetical protein
VDTSVGNALPGARDCAGVEPRTGKLICPRCGESSGISCWDETAEGLLVEEADPDTAAAAGLLARAGLLPPFADRRVYCYSCEWEGLLSADVTSAVFRIRDSHRQEASRHPATAKRSSQRSRPARAAASTDGSPWV